MVAQSRIGFPESKLSITASSTRLRSISLASLISVRLAFGRTKTGPAAVLERLARLFDGEVNIFSATSSDLGKGLASLQG